jgi:hypothetical protein
MALKGLSDRFEEKAAKIYSRYSNKQPGHIHPLLEFKPNDPNRNETANDSRFSPIGSEKRDLGRIHSFLKTPEGIRFLGRQAELQGGNTFSETRLFNPLFPFGHLAGTNIRITRPLATATGVSVGTSAVQVGVSNAISSVIKGLVLGDPNSESDQKSPASDASVGAAGRLQKSTAKTVVNKILGKSGPTGLLNLLPSNVIIRTISAGLNIIDTVGILGVNQRPELNVDGQYYAVALWAGYNKNHLRTNNFEKAGVALRKGDIKGAVSDAAKGLLDEVKARTIGIKQTPVPKSPREGRDDPSRMELSGLRYFIVNNKQADKYLDYSNDNGKQQLEFLKHRPYQLSGRSLLFDDSTIISLDDIPGGDSLIAAKAQLTNQLQSKTKSLFSKIGNTAKTITQDLVGVAGKVISVANKGTSLVNKLGIINLPFGATSPTGEITDLLNGSIAENPAQERMLFSNMSLANQYDEANGEVGFFKEELDQQQTDWLGSIQKLKTDPTYGLGYVGGISPGHPIVDDAGIFAKKRVKVDGGRYLSDNAVNLDPIIANQGGSTSVNTDVKSIIRKTNKDAIDFLFHDYVNNRIIPFKAILSYISEQVNADFESPRYIGRTEKNVVYSGASRDLAFQFSIQAFSKRELNFIWQKINYLTGLCFPAKYSSGFMVPPFVQLTIGNYYLDQPGYIKSVTHNLDESTIWDIDPKAQVPMGITIGVNFSVIEKTQVQVGTTFYGFGTPIVQG